MNVFIEDLKDRAKQALSLLEKGTLAHFQVQTIYDNAIDILSGITVEFTNEAEYVETMKLLSDYFHSKYN